MEFDYFYGQQSEQFSFYRIPKMLFTDDRFWNVSTDAKLLYGILLDRMNLSARNGWLDENGRVYIIFTLEETMAALNCGDNKATKLYNELEKKCGLIERKRQGLGKPNLIYVKNFVTGVDNFVQSRFKSRENHDSGVGETPILESGKPRGNELIQKMHEINADYLGDERMNLNVQLSQPILVVADIGRWDGRYSGYAEIKSGKICDCLYTEMDMCEWYVDKYGDLRADAVHHDGRNYYLYRVYKDNVTDYRAISLRS